MKISIRLFVLLLLMLLIVAVVSAQDDACPTIVETALQATDLACADVERNEVCYGNIQITAVPQADVADFVFETQGDKASLVDVDTMTLSPMNEDDGAWGVALMSVQANLPDTLPGQNVRVLLFGDVEVQNAGDAMEAFYFRSGVGDAACAEAPDSGLLIQTPQGEGEVQLVVNGVDISLGSTAYLTAEPAGEFIFALLDGAATVSVEGESQTLEPGTQTSIPMDEDLNPTGPPSEPEPFENEAVSNLPTESIVIGDGDEAAAGGAIVPLSGNWTAIFGDDITIEGAGCPPGIDNNLGPMIQQAMPQFGVSETNYFDFGGAFDLPTFFAAAEASGVEFTFSNPEPNQHTATMAIEGGSTVEYTFNLMSETLIDITTAINLSIPGVGDCSIIVPMTLEYAD